MGGNLKPTQLFCSYFLEGVGTLPNITKETTPSQTISKNQKGKYLYSKQPWPNSEHHASMPVARGGGRENQAHAQGVVAAQTQEGLYRTGEGGIFSWLVGVANPGP